MDEQERPEGAEQPAQEAPAERPDNGFEWAMKVARGEATAEELIAAVASGEADYARPERTDTRVWDEQEAQASDDPFYGLYLAGDLTEEQWRQVEAKLHGDVHGVRVEQPGEAPEAEAEPEPAPA